MTKRRTKNRGSSKAGRPRKAGARYPGGKLKAPGPNAIVIERRKALAEDVTMASEPLDLIYTRGWITFTEFKAGCLYQGLHMAVHGGVKSTAASSRREVHLSQITSDVPPTFADMTDEQIAAIWGSAMRDEPDPEALEQRGARQWGRWVAINTAMTPHQREVVRAVCIERAWPSWVQDALAGGATDSRERRILVEGLRAIDGCNAAAPEGPSPIESLPDVRPKPTVVLEATAYVNQDGTPLFEAVKIGRR